MDELRLALNRGAKTPIMWLQEICLKQGCQLPRYDEKDLRNFPADVPKFEVLAVVRNFKCVGTIESASGRATTKKLAKQEAATALLFKLGITPTDLDHIRSSKYVWTGSTDTSFVESRVECPMTEVDLVTETITNRSNDATSNKLALVQSLNVGPTSCVELRELCAKRGLENPVYTDLKEEGLAHSKNFHVECRVRGLPGKKPDLVVVEYWNKKKFAKNLAAAKMIELLRSEVRQENNIVKLLLRAEIQEIGKLLCADSRRCKNLISHEHHQFHHFIGPKTRALGGKDLRSEANCLDMLEKVADEEKFEILFNVEDWISHDGVAHSFCELQYSGSVTEPNSVFVGQGESVTQARNNCAKAALNFLKMVTH